MTFFVKFDKKDKKDKKTPESIQSFLVFLPHLFRTVGHFYTIGCDYSIHFGAFQHKRGTTSGGFHQINRNW